MATTTPNFGLHITPSTDTTKKVLDWRNELSSDESTSNMMIIDNEIKENKNNIDNHKAYAILNENGLHGIRYFNDTLSVYDSDDDKWDNVEGTSGGLNVSNIIAGDNISLSVSGNDITINATGGGDGVAPENLTNIKVTRADASLKILWTDPENVSVGGILVSEWAGTKVVRKLGAYPENVNDGILVVDSKVHNQYSSTAFIDTGLTNGNTYYYQLFPYSNLNAINSNQNNRSEGTPMSYKQYGIDIDILDNNPETSITYTLGSTTLTPNSSDWDTIFGYYPVLFKSGIEVGKLDPNDYSKFIDGTDADITSGDSGDVMVAFPLLGVRISQTANIVSIAITEDPTDATFTYYAHTKGNVIRDVFYLGAYKGSVIDQKIRSLSGKSISRSLNCNSARAAAQDNGVGYEMGGVYQCMFRQCLYLLKYKHFNSQVAFGRGVTSYSTHRSTGHGDLVGLNYGTTANSTEVAKLFGIEDSWGNSQEYLDGIYVDDTFNLFFTKTNEFNATNDGYAVSEAPIASSDGGGYTSKCMFTSELGFLGTEFLGSSSTYLSDATYLYKRCVFVHGGNYSNGDAAGFFMFYAINSPTVTNVACGRLMFL